MSTGSMTDTQFTKTFGIMIALFIVLTLILIALGNIMASDVTAAIAEEKKGEHASFVQDRVSPVETAVVGDAPEPVQVAAVAKSGEDVYNGGCVACHQSGIANAPKIDDKAAWEPRLAQGMDTLYKNAIVGIRGMPAKGGNAALSDEDVQAAVDFMIKDVQ